MPNTLGNHWRYFILFSILSIASLSRLSAQYDAAQNGVSCNFSLLNNDFPATTSFSKNQFTQGIEIAYWRHLTPYLNLKFPLRFGNKNFHPTDLAPNEIERTFFAGLDVLAHVKFFKEPNFLSPYLSLGG